MLSLTPRERAFAGGHTLLMQPRVLNYWPGFDPSAGLEMKHLARGLTSRTLCCAPVVFAPGCHVRQISIAATYSRKLHKCTIFHSFGQC